MIKDKGSVHSRSQTTEDIRDDSSMMSHHALVLVGVSFRCLLCLRSMSSSVKLLCIAFKGYHIPVCLSFRPYKILRVLVTVLCNSYVVDVAVMH